MAVDLESYTSPQVALIKELDRAVREKDSSLLAKHLHKDFRHVIHPQSLGKVPINRDEWLATIAQVLSTPVQFEWTYHSIVEAPGKVVIRISVDAKGFGGQDGTDESIWILAFASGEDGSLKLKEVEQFADTRNYLDVFQAGKASK